MKKKRGRQAGASRPAASQRPAGRRRELSKREYAQAQNAKRHRKQRKRRQRLVVVLLLLFVLASAAVITSAVFFKITTVEVTGDPGRYSADQIIGTSGIVGGDNMFSFNASSIEAAIETAFPYIENVRIRRKLPSAVKISVQQAQPSLAVMESGGKYTLLSSGGKVLETGVSKPDGVMEVAGITLENVSAGQKVDKSQVVDFDTLTQVTEALSQWKITGVQKIDLTDKFNITIRYNERVSIAIGSVSQISYKLQFAKYVLDSGLKENETAVIDASTPGKAVVKPIDSISPVPPVSSSQAGEPQQESSSILSEKPEDSSQAASPPETESAE